MKKLLLVLVFLNSTIFLFAGESNTFTGHINMDIDDPSSMLTLKFAVAEWQTSMTLKTEANEDINIIFDLKNDSTIILVNSQNFNRLGIKAPIKQQAELDKSELDLMVVKTDERKKILDYNCSKFIIYKDTDTVTAWVNNEINFNPLGLLMNLSSDSDEESKDGSLFQSLTKELDGLIMRIEYLNEKKVPSSMNVTYIDTDKPDESVFSTSGYNILDMKQLQKAYGR